MTAQDILKHIISVGDSFRPGQDELGSRHPSCWLDIASALCRPVENHLLPRLLALLPGSSLVISPLISADEGSVGALCEAGVPAACINSDECEEFRDALYFAAGRGQYKLLHAALERLTAPSFLEFAAGRVPISMVTVDEAHCISMGTGFRPLPQNPRLSSLPNR